MLTGIRGPEHETWLDEYDQIHRWWIDAADAQRATFSDLERAVTLQFLTGRRGTPADGGSSVRLCRETVNALHALRSQQAAFTRDHPIAPRSNREPVELDRTNSVQMALGRVAYLEAQATQQIAACCELETVRLLLGRREQLREEARQYAVLTPVRARIEAYLRSIPDTKLYYPGAGYVYPSRRFWTRKFIDQYVIVHGHLPPGEKHVLVPGFSGGLHDFTALSAPG